MSSTNRGALRDASDYYVTPQFAIVDFLREFIADNPSLLNRPLLVLDPCSGGDTQRPMAYPKALKLSALTIQTLATNDIREDSLADTHGDYLTMPTDTPWDLIITNPPFRLALEITQKAMQDVADDGWVVMLQRVNWFGGQARKVWWQSNMPTYCYIHSKRMSFMPPGSINPVSGKKYTSDSIEYAHFCWRKGHKPKFTQLRVI
jgi:hypothetical protein